MSVAYKEGWADYRSALYLTSAEVACLVEEVQLRGRLYYDDWLKGWRDAAEADDTLMD